MDKKELDELIDSFKLIRNIVEDKYREGQITLAKNEIDKSINSIRDVLQKIKSKLPKGKVALERIDHIYDDVYQMNHLSDALQGKFMLFIMGSGKNGKSTLINALIGQPVAEENINPKTWKIDVFVDKVGNKVKLKYKDGSIKDVDINVAKKILEEEDQKFELGKKKFREAKQTVPKGLSSQALKEMNEELRKKYTYRSSLAEMIHSVKNSSLLKKYNVVDTPGLNQEFSGEVSANAKEYYGKADGIIWVLPGDKLAAKGDKQEIINILEDYGIRDNIIVVINKLDNILANGQTIDGVLADAEKFYGDIFKEFIPISAKIASKARAVLADVNSTQEELIEAKKLLEISNFPQLQDRLERKLLNNAVHLQIQGKVENTILLLKNINRKTEDLKIILQRVKNRYDTQIIDWDKITNMIFAMISSQREALETEVVASVYSNAKEYEDTLWEVKNNNTEWSKIVKNDVIKSYEIERYLRTFADNIIQNLTRHYEYHLRQSTFNEYETLAKELENLKGRPQIPYLNYTIDLTNVSTGLALGNDILSAIENFIKRLLGDSMATRISKSFRGRFSKILDDLEEKLKQQVSYATEEINKNRRATFSPLYGNPNKIEEIVKLLNNIQQECIWVGVPDITLRQVLNIESQETYLKLCRKIENSIISSKKKECNI